MPRNKKFKGDMTDVGRMRTPLFAHLPNIHSLFANRHKRFQQLAPTSPVKDYLLFLSQLSQAQHQTIQTLNQRKPFIATQAKSAAHAATPLEPGALINHAQYDTIVERFLKKIDAANLPQEAKLVLNQLQLSQDLRQRCANNLINQQLPPEQVAEHIFILGALQVVFSHAAAQLEQKSVKPLKHNLCPCCGGTHSAAMVVGWANSEGARFCSCLFCGTMWHYVRVKCTFCGATGGIEYQEIDGGPGTIKAETCKNCGQYCKTIDHQQDVFFDVFSDDIGSIALDLLIKQQGNFQRGAFNPFMAGY